MSSLSMLSFLSVCQGSDHCAMQWAINQCGCGPSSPESIFTVPGNTHTHSIIPHQKQSTCYTPHCDSLWNSQISKSTAFTALLRTEPEQWLSLFHPPSLLTAQLLSTPHFTSFSYNSSPFLLFLLVLWLSTSNILFLKLQHDHVTPPA